MAKQSRTNLKAVFEDGDTLTGSNLADLIDSYPNLVDTTAQSFASNVTVPNLAANSVSADTGYITNLFVAGTQNISTLVAATARISGDVYVSGSIKCRRLIDLEIPHFNIWSQATAYVTASASGSWFNIFNGSGFDVSAQHGIGFTVSGDSIQYTGNVTAHILLSMMYTLKGDSGTHHYEAAIFENGTELTASNMKQSVWSNILAPGFTQGVWVVKPNQELDVRFKQEATASLTFEIHSFTMVGRLTDYETS